MVGMVFPEATRWRCSSNPVIPGICTSAIRQEVWGTWRELKNSSADRKAWAVYPSDLMSPLIASRIDSSSSTTEIWGFVFGTLPPSSGFPEQRTRCYPRQHVGKINKAARYTIILWFKGVSGIHNAIEALRIVARVTIL